VFNFGRGDVLRAAAERDRALAELDLTRRETDAAVARARRELAVARDRLRRTAELVRAPIASRHVTASLQRGAVPLASVLEAQRNAREILANYIDDPPARMRQSVRCDCSPRVRTSREPPRAMSIALADSTPPAGRQRQLGEWTGRLSRTRSAWRLHRRGDGAAVPAYLSAIGS